MQFNLFFSLILSKLDANFDTKYFINHLDLNKMKNKFWIKCSYITLLCCLVLNNLTFAQGSSQNQASVKNISEGIYLIKGFICNITAVDGPDGILLIDTGLNSEKLGSVISTFSDHPVKYILNTNFHSDHIGDNKILCDRGAMLIAHENTRYVLATEWEAPVTSGNKSPVVPPQYAKYLPKICFRDTLRLYINDNVIDAIHYPAAHSSGDAIYLFRNKNTIHVGDLFVLYGVPYIDYSHGGTVSGLIQAVDSILKLCDEKTILIPGHGEISNREGLLEYRDMLFKSKSVIAKLVSEGKSLDEIIRLQPIRSLFKGRNASYESSFITSAFKEQTK
jgi:glyoxylase-like metal-dependent hydrolase (beta-lactamase superfamily II)